MPRDNPAVVCRLAKELVVPKADRPAQKLARRDGEGRVPEDVVKAGSDAPGAQGVKQHLGWVGRLVRAFLTET